MELARPAYADGAGVRRRSGSGESSWNSSSIQKQLWCSAAFRRRHPRRGIVVPTVEQEGLSLAGKLGISLVYQFWLHSTLIPKVGPLEFVLNTPSAHRVHHASNRAYIDRNFCGILVIFDRLFGTYKAEDDQVKLRYGILPPMPSNNPLVIVDGEIIALVRDVRQAGNWGDRWRLIFMPPGWSPANKVQKAPLAPSSPS
ncbi:sterol desaturase family protein [Dongia soli]|uniref:Sterol desaturase family protein n=1 Tax=Dongia soli TaxID=600628 RepID=A0ABU5EG76_9PROT|nr:sterol desaturase family protein [Dongia soli]MDY0885361.1 sterol desaturase family protein [Dongia soli]